MVAVTVTYPFAFIAPFVSKAASPDVEYVPDGHLAVSRLPDLSSALALRDAQAIAPFPRYGCGTAVQARSGVAAFFVLESYDRRRGVATYALQVVNETQTRLVCRAWVVTRHGNAAFAHPATFEIEPFSAIAMQMPVRVRDFDSFERAVAEIAGDDVHYVVEAAPPPVRSRRSTFMMAAAAVLIFGTLAIGATCLLAGMIPRIAAFAVPPMALAGTTVAAEYDAVGFGSLAYQVLAPDGHRVAGGALSDRSGSIPVALSPSSDGGAYTLQMTMRGPLGSAKEVRVLNAIPPKIGGGARIADIAVNPIVAKPGQAVSIAYAANGDSGYVRLVGSDGTIWAQKPYSPQGSDRVNRSAGEQHPRNAGDAARHQGALGGRLQRRPFGRDDRTEAGRCSADDRGRR